MHKKIIAMGLLVVFLSAATSAFAEDVFVTKNGHKYHKQICRLIKNKKPEQISKKDALEKRLEPCGLCFKEDLSKAIDHSIQPKVSSKKN